MEAAIRTQLRSGKQITITQELEMTMNLLGLSFRIHEMTLILTGLK